MKLVTFLNGNNEERLGLFHDGKVADLRKKARTMGFEIPSGMNEFLAGGEKFIEIAQRVDKAFKSGDITGIEDIENVKLMAPVPHPPSCRDGYAFRQHVASARKNRGVEMIPEFDQYPIFYFTNHNGIAGEGDVIVEKDHLEKCDFELEVAAVIGKKGRNIDAKDADDYIIGYTIMNDLSARLLQMEEMKLNLGPAKGKDFSTTIGPWLVTKDELEEFKIDTGHGITYDLKMTAKHNGKLVSEGNMKDMTWTFAEILERVSYGVDVYPGDVIGSGTVGTGCYLELNGTWAREAKERGEEHVPVWLNDGDDIVLEMTGLGILKNRIVLSENNVSILAKKKNV